MAAGLLLTACSSASGAPPGKSAMPSSSQVTTAGSGMTSSSAPRPSAHIAADREATLPARIDGKALSRVSTTGAAIFSEFGSTAWARRMTAFLAQAGKTPADMRYAQAWDPSETLDLDAGAFQVSGMSAATLGQGIVASSLPDSPGLSANATTVAGKRVMALSDPGAGLTLYLYEQHDVVFYVGSSDDALVDQYLVVLR